jgi:predicted transcriptional regulator
MTNADPVASLSRRERQIMDVLHRDGAATVAEVIERMADPPGYSAVRAMLRTLESKGHVFHREDGPRYVFAPVAGKEEARSAALSHLVDTFFDGSARAAVAALLGTEARLEKKRLDAILQLIDQARQEGR